MARMALGRRNSLITVIFFLGAAFFSGGCVSLLDPETSQENRSELVGSIEEGQSFGQEFVSRRPGLNSVQLWLNVDAEAAPNARIIAELFHAPGEKQMLAVVLVPFSEVPRGGPLHLEIPVQPGDGGQNYYLSLKTSGGRIQVFGRNEDAYPQGEAYVNGIPLESDAAFRLSYSYGLTAVLTDLREGMGNAWLSLPLAILLLLPGWLLLDLSGLGREMEGGEKTGIAVGLSLAVIPLVMLWTSVIRWPWSQGAVIAAGGVLCIAAAWRFGASLASWRRHPAGSPAEASSPGEISPGLEASASGAGRSEAPSNKSGFDWINLALFGVFLFSLAIRLIMTRDLAAPAWVDSVHHALITRLIVEQGGVPASYAPYLDLDAAGYHPGFHSLVAAFHWLSGLDIPSAMLLLGQVLNALSVYAAYLFTAALLRRRSAALIAALITGVFTPMPAYYTSWGRYTQLAGLLILPAALALTLQIMKSRQGAPSEIRIGLLAQTTSAWRTGTGQWRDFLKAPLLTGTAIGGLFLIHYRVLAFLACLLATVVLVQAAKTGIGSLRKAAHEPSWPDWLKSVGVLGLAASVSMILTLPWWPDTLRSFILPKSGVWNAGNGQLFSDFSWSYLNSGLGKYTLILAGLGLLWGFIRRQSFILILAFWVVMLFALANPGIVGLPGSGLVNNISVEIILFLPISLLGGFLLAGPVDTGFNLLSRKWHKTYTAALVIAGAGLALFGARQLIPILNPVTFLFREADRPAIAWVEDHLPEDATLLINPFSWGYGLYAGNDGGYWITPLSGRKTLPPPVLYGFDNRTDNILALNETIQSVMEYSSNPTALHSLMKRENIDYIFVGRRGGLFSPRALQESGLFEILYQDDGVWIFQTR